MSRNAKKSPGLLCSSQIWVHWYYKTRR